MERLQQLRKELEELKASVGLLQEEISALRKESHQGRIQALLAQRGTPIVSYNEESRVLLPAEASHVQRERFYGLMRRYSFRLFLRDLIQSPEGALLHKRIRYCSPKTVRSYLKTLSELNIVELRPGKGYQLLKTGIESFGATLEWYVSQVFEKEFLAPSHFRVRLQDTRYGGDYDVLAIVSGYLVYVEVKSSPPRGIEMQQIQSFLNRLLDLRPHIAVFFVDTELRIQDKIVPLFDEALAGMDHRPEEWTVSPLTQELFHVGHAIYLINSRKGIYTNLRHCLRDFIHREKKAGMASDVSSRTGRRQYRRYPHSNGMETEEVSFQADISESLSIEPE